MDLLELESTEPGLSLLLMTRFICSLETVLPWSDRKREPPRSLNWSATRPMRWTILMCFRCLSESCLESCSAACRSHCRECPLRSDWDSRAVHYWSLFAFVRSVDWVL